MAMAAYGRRVYPFMNRPAVFCLWRFGLGQWSQGRFLEPSLIWVEFGILCIYHFRLWLRMADDEHGIHGLLHFPCAVATTPMSEVYMIQM